MSRRKNNRRNAATRDRMPEGSNLENAAQDRNGMTTECNSENAVQGRMNAGSNSENAVRGRRRRQRRKNLENDVRGRMPEGSNLQNAAQDRISDGMPTECNSENAVQGRMNAGSNSENAVRGRRRRQRRKNLENDVGGRMPEGSNLENAAQDRRRRQGENNSENAVGWRRRMQAGFNLENAVGGRRQIPEELNIQNTAKGESENSLEEIYCVCGLKFHSIINLEVHRIYSCTMPPVSVGTGIKCDCGIYFSSTRHLEDHKDIFCQFAKELPPRGIDSIFADQEKWQETEDLSNVRELSTLLEHTSISHVMEYTNNITNSSTSNFLPSNRILQTSNNQSPWRAIYPDENVRITDGISVEPQSIVAAAQSQYPLQNVRPIYSSHQPQLQLFDPILQHLPVHPSLNGNINRNNQSFSPQIPSPSIEVTNTAGMGNILVCPVPNVNPPLPLVVNLIPVSEQYPAWTPSFQSQYNNTFSP